MDMSETPDRTKRSNVIIDLFRTPLDLKKYNEKLVIVVDWRLEAIILILLGC